MSHIEERAISFFLNLHWWMQQWLTLQFYENHLFMIESDSYVLFRSVSRQLVKMVVFQGTVDRLLGFFGSVQIQEALPQKNYYMV